MDDPFYPAPLIVTAPVEPVLSFRTDDAVFAIAGVNAADQHGQIAVGENGLVVTTTGVPLSADDDGTIICLTCQIRQLATLSQTPEEAAMEVANLLESVNLPPSLGNCEENPLYSHVDIAVVVAGCTPAGTQTWEVAAASDTGALTLRVSEGPVIHATMPWRFELSRLTTDPAAMSNQHIMIDRAAKALTAGRPGQPWDLAVVTAGGLKVLSRHHTDGIPL